MKVIYYQLLALCLFVFKRNQLGEIQRKWIWSLIIHPKRQLRSRLGRKDQDAYRACCLGEALIVAKLGCWDDFGFLREHETGNPTFLTETYMKIGLYSSDGDHALSHKLTLAALNDAGNSWPQIAFIILENPKMYLKEKK